MSRWGSCDWGLGKAPKPKKLTGEKAEAYERQSEWLTNTGYRLLRFVDVVEMFTTDANDGVRIGVSEESSFLEKRMKVPLEQARRQSREFKKTSASASARHAMASNALGRLARR